jgi:hypothetical protein
VFPLLWRGVEAWPLRSSLQRVSKMVVSIPFVIFQG